MEPYPPPYGYQPGYDPSQPGPPPQPPHLELDVGEVLGTTMKVIGRRPGLTLGTAFLFTLPTAAANVWFSWQSYGIMRTSLRNPGDPNAAFAMLSEWIRFLPALAVFVIFAALSHLIIQGVIATTAVQTAGGHWPTAAEAYGTAFSRMGWLFLTGFAFGMVFIAGFMACCIPGLIAAIVFGFASTVCVVERLGPIEAMQRSLTLTQGHRVNLFLVYLALFGVYLAFVCIVSAVTATVAGVSVAMNGGADPSALSNPFSVIGVIEQLINYGVSAVWTTALVTATAVAYARVLGIREGMDPRTAANVFS